VLGADGRWGVRGANNARNDKCARQHQLFKQMPHLRDRDECARLVHMARATVRSLYSWHW
jgi:hypothetical protein